ncbi:DOPA 4,5-dioxygenase family protein [Marinomonas mediterranea]|uniref:DOPA 4,5-dioxygenase family protein n=1 Tax=Marinomonas mediterranea TaxID=119864 RepID=UPI00234B2FF5|nr:DOPA 4,5-dioxygenase family protein [Marinomonas mediterranea]WCN10317.1 4,5-dioxygenase [Marinomonas mediterranea]
MILNNKNILAYHAHIYYADLDGLEKARELANAANAQFSIKVGRFHEKNVGPHSMWSCQLSFLPSEYGSILPWLMLNRGDLDLFVHFVTGDDYFDHTQGVSWLGSCYELNLSQFTQR